MKPSRQARRAMNEALPCANPRCRKNRHTFSRFCSTCTSKFLLYGSPNGRAIHRRQYVPEIEEVSTLLDANSDHPGLQAALREIESFLVWCGNRPDVEGAMTVAALRYAENVSTMRILKEVCGFTMYWHRNSDRYPGDTDFVHVLGYRILALNPSELVVSRTTAKRYRKLAGKQARVLAGSGIYERIKPFVVNVLTTCKNKEKRNNEREEAFKAPLR